MTARRPAARRAVALAMSRPAVDPTWAAAALSVLAALAALALR